jgi:hypothetical protein
MCRWLMRFVSMFLATFKGVMTMQEVMQVIFRDEWGHEVEEETTIWNGKIPDDDIVKACELPQGAVVAEFTVFGTDFSEDFGPDLYADRWGKVEFGEIKWFSKQKEDDND